MLIFRKIERSCEYGYGSNWKCASCTWKRAKIIVGWNEIVIKTEYSYQDINDLPKGFSVPKGRGTCAKNKVTIPCKENNKRMQTGDILCWLNMEAF